MEQHKKIKALQGLRMFLFLAIFLSHIGTFSIVKNSIIFSEYFSHGLGAQAVTYFFVLSGFVASVSESGKTATDKKGYFKYIGKKLK